MEIDTTTQAPVVDAPSFPAPDMNAGLPTTQAPAVDAPQVTTTPPATKTIFVGGRAFNTPEEALQYADTQMRVQAATPAPAPQKSFNDVDPADLIFEDPKAAVRLIREQTKTEIRQEYQTEQAQKNLWDGFYDKNRDLNSTYGKDIVEVIKAKKWNEIKDLPISQSLDILAKEARNFISGVRGNGQRQETMNSNGATTIHATPGTAPRVQTQTQKPETFSDQIKALRKSKKTG